MKQLFLSLLLIYSALTTSAQNIYTIAGGGNEYNGTHPAISLTLAGISGSIAWDNSGNYYIPDYTHNRIRKVDGVTGISTIVAGTGTEGYNGDGILAVNAQLHGPTAIALDADENIYIADYSNNRIRKVDMSTGLISTVAGTGIYGFNGDSILADTAQITSSTAIVVDTVTNDVYFTELGNSRIRKIDASNGFIYTVAGTGTQGYNGENISADTAQLNFPMGLAIDIYGDLYVAETENQRIRKIDMTSGLIFTVAGNGIQNYNGEGIQATTANLNYPYSVAVDTAGNIFIADTGNDRIRKVSTNGTITSVAGNGLEGYSGDGNLADSAQLYNVRGLSVDKCGNLYLSEYYSGRVRQVTSYLVQNETEHIICHGVCNGSISVDVSGGVSPYNYSWSNGLGGGTNQTNLCAGTYTLTTVAANGCKLETPIQVIEPDLITVHIQTTSATCAANGAAIASPSGGAWSYSYLWSNGQTTNQATGLAGGMHTITVTDTNNCSVTQPFTMLNDPAPFTSAPICMVTVDSLSRNNIVIWDKTAFTTIDTFYILREIATNDYQPIGAVPFDSLSQFIDTVRTAYFPNTGNPNGGTYRYKLQTQDTCGNFSELSPYHNTIYINNNNGVFSWTQLYTIENGTNPVSNYILMRDDNSTGDWQQVGSVAGTQQSISDPDFLVYESTASWRLQTQWSIFCEPTLFQSQSSGKTESFSTSFSNKFTNVPDAIGENSFNTTISISPNPSNGLFTIQFSQILNEKIILELYNVLGEKIYSQINEPSNKISIDRSVDASGVYFINIRSGNKQATQKIIVR